METYPKLPELFSLLTRWQGEFQEELLNALKNKDVIIRELRGDTMSAEHIFQVYFHRQKLQDLRSKEVTVLGYDNLLPALESLPGYVDIMIIMLVTDESGFSIFVPGDFKKIVGVIKSLNNNKGKMLRFISESRDNTRRIEYYSNK